MLQGVTLEPKSASVVARRKAWRVPLPRPILRVWGLQTQKTAAKQLALNGLFKATPAPNPSDPASLSRTRDEGQAHIIPAGVEKNSGLVVVVHHCNVGAVFDQPPRCLLSAIILG